MGSEKMDIPALVSSEEWKPLVEATARAIFENTAEFDGPYDETAHLWQADARAALSAFLTAAVEKGVAREAEGFTKPFSGKWGADEGQSTVPACDFSCLIIKTGDK